MKAHHPLMSKISDPWKVIYKGIKHYEELGTSLPLSGKKLWKEGHSRKIKTTIIHTFRGVPFYSFLFSSSISSHSYHRKKEDKNEVAIKVLSSPKKAVSEHQMASMASRSGNGFFPLRVAKLSKRPLFPHFNVHTTTDYCCWNFHSHCFEMD